MLENKQVIPNKYRVWVGAKRLLFIIKNRIVPVWSKWPYREWSYCVSGISDDIQIATRKDCGQIVSAAVNLVEK